MNTYTDKLPTTFDELRYLIGNRRQEAILCFVDSLDRNSELCDLHCFRGEIQAFDDVLTLLRRVTKFGEDL